MHTFCKRAQRNLTHGFVIIYVRSFSVEAFRFHNYVIGADHVDVGAVLVLDVIVCRDFFQCCHLDHLVLRNAGISEASGKAGVLHCT